MLRERLGKELLYFDGGMGTLLQEEQQRQAEEHLLRAAEIGRGSGIPLKTLQDVLAMVYEEGE